MKLNEKIYYCRKKEGLSQEKLAEVLDVSRQAVSKWETGDALPEIGKISLIAKTFHVTTDWLLSEEEPENSAEQAQNAAAFPDVTNGQDTPSPAPDAEEHNWIDSVPRVLQTLIHRYGWLAGVRIAFSGALFIAFGVVMRLLTRTVIPVQNTFPFDPYGGVTYGGMGIDSITVSANNGFDIISGFVIIIGVVLLITGIALAVLLKDNQNQR